MATPRYVSRIARLPEVFDLLAAHPDGIAITDLAAGAGVPVDELREDLLAFYAADLKPLMLGLSRPAVLEFLGADGAEEDPNTAEVVRICEDGPIEELGVEHVDPAELALVYTAAQALLEIDPDDQPLREAVEVLTETMLGEAVPAEPVPGAEAVGAFEHAIAEQRRVRIVYSRSWAEGVIERVIDPYLLARTRRGWEVDAGPLDDPGLRSYLLANVRSAELLEEGFAEPAGLTALLAEQRATATVRVRIPHAARWAADEYAERVRVVAHDELTVTLDLDLLPPLEERVGRLLLVCGPEATVVDPPRLVAEGPRLAARLLAHHRA